MLLFLCDPSRFRVLLTGVTSIHGWPICEQLRKKLGDDRTFCIRPPLTTRPEGDNFDSVCMTDTARLSKINKDFAPTHVLHMAGVCDLDMCEDDPGRAHAINVMGTKNIVDIFSPSCYIMYLSADLVFSGNNPPPHGYAEDAIPDPVSVVGKTYLAAEKEMARAENGCIVRIGLPMGTSVQGEKGAIDFIEGRFRRNLPMTLFYDEWRSCIDCNELADMVSGLLFSEETGIFHCGGPQPRSLYDIGQWIIRRGGYDQQLLKRCSRADEVGGPPRVGNIHLNSAKIENVLKKKIKSWP
jgi:dTDP-4-dehydrorhamnose reductase